MILSWLIILVGLVVIAIIIQRSKMPLGYENLNISQNKKQSIVLNGVIQSQQIAYLSFQKGGEIVEMSYKTGDFVKRGTVLVKLNPVEENIQYTRVSLEKQMAEIKLEKMNELLKIEKIKLRKLKHSSLKNKQIQEHQIRAVKKDIKIQQKLIKKNQWNIYKAQVDLNHTYLKAPFDGIINFQNVHLNELVAPYSPVVVIENPQLLEIQAYATQNQLKWIHKGTKAKIFFNNNDRKTSQEALVSSVNLLPTSIDNNLVYRIIFHFTQKVNDNIKLGSSVNIVINYE